MKEVGITLVIEIMESSWILSAEKNRESSFTVTEHLGLRLVKQVLYIFEIISL